MSGTAPVTDEYFPENGDPEYDVGHYDLTLGYDPASNHLSGRAVLDAVALTELSVVRLDLSGLRVTKVTVDASRVAKYAQKGDKLVVRLQDRLSPEQPFRVTVSYRGRPRPVPDGTDAMGWEELTDGVIVAGQTNGAPSWFPCNDRPGSKASYRFEVTVPSAYHAVANGVLRTRRRGAGATTWVYEQQEPMATYLATVHLGRYVAREVAAEPVPMTAVLPARLLDSYDRAFGRQPEMMELFIRRFGPYPFPAYTVVVTDDELEIPLEAQGLSAFGSNFLTDDWESVRLVAHELAHQWFGNSLTLVTWRDIWLHEGFACYCEWLWSEESGGPTAHERAVEHWDRLAGLDQDLRLGDPGPQDMFDDRVYKRGALLLHALRLTLGEDTFFGLLREWTTRHRHGSVTTQMFIDLAGELSDQDLEPLLTSWLFQEALPPLPPG
ncbi:MAG TPA: M1 family metallopeptidase [Nocardioides sp.]|uniref:M1 family metallopeptidase n=1 Tax=Nocardioides sp. TaxID=35761 RepID=UPI002BB0D535|nr:M1 family metallopeptidase [Nocardioides sp.]HQR26588.1 M1 family metallopeptidase [Nocardioides sp.]